MYKELPVMFSLNPEEPEDEITDGAIICPGTPQDMELIDYSTVEVDSVQKEASADVPVMLSLEGDVEKTPVDVVFLLQSSGQLENTFTNQKTMIYELLDDLNAVYGQGSVRAAVMSCHLSGEELLTSPEGDIWFSEATDLRQALDALEYEYTSEYTDRGKALQKLQEEVTFQKTAARFIVRLMNGFTSAGDSYFDQINTCAQLGINYSELMAEGYVYADPDFGKKVAEAIAGTNGMNATFGEDSLSELYGHIVTYAAPPQVEFDVIVPTGWKHIVLDGILDAENGVNSDMDELTDWEEVMTERLRRDSDGTVMLPTIQECMEWTEKPYAEDGLERFKAAQWVSGMPTSVFGYYLSNVLNDTKILPIHSDPTVEDSDGDGLLDDEEYYLDTCPLDTDSDKDGLSDLLEVELWFDPLESNPDGDSYNDYEEWKNNTSPFVYTMTAKESKDAFIKGGLLGDFETADNTETLLGQVVFGFIPFLADARDLIANAFVNGDGWAAGVNALGLALDCTGAGGVAGDGAKAASKLGEFVAKYADDAPKALEAVIQTSKHLPEDMDVLPKLAKTLSTGTLNDIIRSLEKGDSIIKAEYDELLKVFKAAGRNTDEVVNATRFKSFRTLKKHLGSPGEGKEWHHIVEQCQAKSTRSGFDIRDINSVNNVLATPKDVHKEISRYYSRSHDFTGKKTFRDWLNGKSFDEQLEYGMQIWEQEMKRAGYIID